MGEFQINYGSVCSGIEAATVAWHPLGWRPSFFAEIEPFPCAVLSAYYPTVPNHGDMTKFKEWPDATLDLLVGGTPCQSFSFAGLRKGLDDPRGNLTLVYLAVADKYRPEWLVWENVPGVLSDRTGAFGSFLAGLGELGYGFAYRVLDAQYFGVPQRRRRVFVVGCLGSWQRAAAVLFERHSLQGNPAPSRQKGERVALPVTSRVDRGGAHREANGNNLIAPTIPARTRGGGGLGTDFDCDGGLVPSPHADLSPALKARDSKGPSSDGDGDGAILVPMVAHSLRADGFDASEDGTGRGTPLVPVAHTDVMPTMMSGANTPAGRNARSGHSKDSYIVPVAFNARQDPDAWEGRTGPLDTDGSTQAVAQAMQVRRLTPRECERLQGFPDDYTLVEYRKKQAADGPRYKALGNSMAVPVMRWIGQRIQEVSSL